MLRALAQKLRSVQEQNARLKEELCREAPGPSSSLSISIKRD